MAKTKTTKAVKKASQIKRIKMLMDFASGTTILTMGKSYRVPQDIPAETAKDWIAAGVAQEDKSLDIPETK